MYVDSSRTCSACERRTQLPSIIAVTRGPSTSDHKEFSAILSNHWIEENVEENVEEDVEDTQQKLAAALSGQVWTFDRCRGPIPFKAARRLFPGPVLRSHYPHKLTKLKARVMSCLSYA